MSEQAIIYLLSVAPFAQTAIVILSVVLGIIGFLMICSCGNIENLTKNKDFNRSLIVLAIAITLFFIAMFIPRSDNLVIAKKNYKMLCEEEKEKEEEDCAYRRGY